MPEEKKLTKEEKAALKKAQKAKLLAEQEEQRKKQAELDFLRGRVKRLLAHFTPPTPLQYAAACVPVVRDNPWLLINDKLYAEKFLEGLVEVLRQHSHIPYRKLADRVKELKAVESKTLLQQQQQQQQQQASSPTPTPPGGATGDSNNGLQVPSSNLDVGAAVAAVASAASASRATTPFDKRVTGSSASSAVKDAYEQALDNAAEEEKMAESDKRVRMVFQLFEAHEGIRDLSAFAVRQPTFFVSDPQSLNLLVELLKISVHSEDLFACVLSILLPTIKNKNMSALLAATELSAVIMQFVQHHMPECAEDVDGDDGDQHNGHDVEIEINGTSPAVDSSDPNKPIESENNNNNNNNNSSAAGNNSGVGSNKEPNEAVDSQQPTHFSKAFAPDSKLVEEQLAESPPTAQNGSSSLVGSSENTGTIGSSAGAATGLNSVVVLRHQYSSHTFEIIMTCIHYLSLSTSLRDAVKSDAKNYLHLRGLASGVIKGFSKKQQMMAQKCLHLFIEDSVEEKKMASEFRPRPANQAMVIYHKGHVHELFCHSTSTEANGGTNSMGFPRSRKFKPGFGDAASLEVMNRQLKKRSQQAAASKR